MNQLQDKKIFLSFLRTLTQIISWKVFLTLALTIFLSLTISFELTLLIPILELIGANADYKTLGGLAQLIHSIFLSLGIKITLINILGIYLLIFSFHSFLSYLQSNLNGNIQIEFIKTLTQRLYKSITKTNWLFFVRNRSSDFVHALTTELERVDTAIQSLLLLIVDIAITFIYTIFALQLSLPLTIFVFSSGGILLILLRRKAYTARTIGEKISEVTNSMYSALIDHMAGMKATKSYSAEKQNTNIFVNITDKVAQAYKKSVQNIAEVKCWFDIGAVIVLSLILYMALNLHMSAANILLLIYLFSRMIPKFSSMLQNYQLLANSLPGFSTVIKIQENCNSQTEPSIEFNENINFTKDIKLQNICFSYHKDETKNALFKNLNCTIEAHRTTAIVGSSGSGKSTIADLVMGLLIPDEGCILIDNISLTSSRIKSWREQIGYVAQDTFLFHDTIKANLLWACPNASDEDINEALNMASCEEFISRLPNRIETTVGDRGVLLSGGERQRLALARALLRKPRLLILDEATSSIDSENEEKIISTIEKLHGQVTVLIISHRLSAIHNADMIYILENGNIIESGSWDNLIHKTNGKFYKMYNMQSNLKVQINL